MQSDWLGTNKLILLGVEDFMAVQFLEGFFFFLLLFSNNFCNVKLLITFHFPPRAFHSIYSAKCCRLKL